MASLFNTKISNTYVGLIKTIDNAVISSSLRELTDGSGNQTGVYLNNAGDFKASGILEWGSLKDTGENITITKFVDEADGIANNDNDTTIPTSAAIVDYVASRITLEDLDFSGTTGTGSVDLDSQVFAVVGTANEIETSAGSQQLQIGIVTNPTLSGNVTITGDLNISQGEIINIGSNFDLYATATGEYIQYGTNPVIFNGSGDVIFRKQGSEEKTAVFTPQGSAKLYYDNSLKLETTTTGVNVTGDVITTGDVRVPDGEFLSSGNSNDLTITNTGVEALITNYTGNFTIQNLSDDNDIIFKSDDGSGGLETYFYLDGSTKLNRFPVNARWDDNIRAEFGSGGDLDIYHDGTDSYIDNNGGDLYIMQQANDKDISFQSDNGSGGTTEYFRVDGGATLTRFEKNARFTDSVLLELGTSGDLQIFHNSTDSFIDNHTGNLTIRNRTDDGDIVFQSDDGVGGLTEYFKIDGSSEKNEFFKSLFLFDNVKIQLGNAGDLEIYHDGSSSFINDSGTGDLRILTSRLVLNNPADNENMLRAVENGAVELFYNNVKKLETTSTGVTITGVVVADGLDMGDSEQIRLGNSQDLLIFHDGANSYIKDTGAGNLFIQASNSLNLRSSDGEWYMDGIANGAVNLYYNNVKKFETTSTGISVTGDIDSTGNLTITNTLPHIDLIDSDNNDDFRIRNNNGIFEILDLTNTGSRFKIDSDGHSNVTGNLQVDGNQVITGDLTVNGTTTTVNTETLAVEDPLISLAKDNSANSVDIGFYGRYNDGSNRYLGLFSNASDDNKFVLFKGLTEEPTTTVNVSGTGFARGTLLLDSLGATGQISTTDELIVGSGEYISWGTSGSAAIEGSTVSNRLRFYTNSTLALTLDSSQNAEFAADVNLLDSKTLNIGTGNDLQLIHDGTNSVITNLTGHLYIRNDADDKRIEFQADDGTGGRETYFYCDGAGGGTQPFTVFPDSAVIAMGSNHDMRIEHTGGAAKIDNYTGSLTITQHQDDGNIIFNNDNGSGGVHTYFHVDGGVDRTIFSRSTRHKDGVVSAFGTSEDLQIYHDGNNSYILDNGTGELRINSDNAVRIRKHDNETMALFTANGAVELRYDNIVKFETTSTGVEITGNITFGDSHFIGDDSDDNLLIQSSSGENIKLDSADDIILDADGGDIKLQDAGASFGQFINSSQDFVITVNTDNKDLKFNGYDDGTLFTALTLDMSNGGSAIFADDIDMSDSKKINIGNSADLQIYHDGNNSYIETSSGSAGDFYIKSQGTNHDLYLQAVDDVYIRPQGGENGIKVLGDAGVEVYYDNSLKFKTISTGTITTGYSRADAFAAQTSDTYSRIFAPTGAAFNSSSSSVAGALTFILPQVGVNCMLSIKIRVFDYSTDESFDVNVAGYYYTGNNWTRTSAWIDSSAIDDLNYNVRFGVRDSDGRGVISIGETNTSWSYVKFGVVEVVPAHSNASAEAWADNWSATILSSFTGYTMQTSRSNLQVNNWIRNGSDLYYSRGDVTIGDTTYGSSLGQLRIINDASSSPAVLSLMGYGNVADNTDYAAIEFAMQQSGTGGQVKASIKAQSDGTGENAADLRFGTANLSTGLTEKMRIDSNGVIQLTETSSSGFLNANGTSLELDVNRHPETGAFGDTNKSHARIQLAGDNGGSTIKFNTANANNTTASERMRISSTGEILKGITSAVSIGGTPADANSTEIGNGYIILARDDTATAKQISFGKNGSEVGSIETTGSATAYNTSSDYRLKEDLQDFNGLDKVSKISVYDFKWKSDGSRGYGVMAHELEEVLPQAISGEKDAEKMQQVDYSKIVPLLVKSIQELQEEVKELKQQCNCK